MSIHTWLVAKTGNDANSGHASTYPINLANDAKLTIQAAVNASSSGDTVIIYPGSYNENVDLDTGNKSISLVGFDRNLSKINPATGYGIKSESHCVFKNLAIEAIQVDSAAIGLDGKYKTNIVVDNCNIYGGYDGIGFNDAFDIVIKNSRIRGLYDGGNAGGVDNLLIDNCVFIGLGTYGTTVKCRGLFIGGVQGCISNTVFRAERSDTSSQDFGAADMSAGSTRAILNLINCEFYTKGGSNATGKAFGIRTSFSTSRVALLGCSFYIESTNASEKYDINNGGGKIVVCCCAYDTFYGDVRVIDPVIPFSRMTIKA